MTRFNDVEIRTLKRIIDAVQLHSIPERLNIHTEFTLVYDFAEASIMESIKGKLSRRPVHVLDLDTWEEFQDYSLQE